MQKILNVDIIKGVGKGVSGTKHVMVTFEDGTKQEGFMKNSKTKFMDDIEVTTSGVGEVLGVSTANVIRYKDGENDCIISLSVLQDYEQEELVEFINFSEASPLRPDENYKKVLIEDQEIKGAINVVLEIFENSEGVTEEEIADFRKSYFEMLMFDYATNQVDRNAHNFGVIRNNNTGNTRFSPLFDNGCISKPDLPENSCEFNFARCNREKLIECLYKNFYPDISPMSKKISTLMQDKDGKASEIIQIAKENLDEKTNDWYISNIRRNVTRISELDREYGLKEKTLSDELADQVLSPEDVDYSKITPRAKTPEEGQIKH